MIHRSRRLALTTASIILIVILSSAEGSISGSISAELLKDQSGTAIPKTSLFILVASTSDTSFADINLSLAQGKSLTLGSILGSDEEIVYRGNINVSATASNGFLDRSFVINYNDASFTTALAPGERLALLWFPTLTTSSTTLPLNARFGFYDGGAATAANQTDADSSNVEAGTNPWISPNDGTFVFDLGFFTKDSPQVGSAAGSQSAAGLALGTVIPEASSGLLGLLGGVGLAGFRRQRQRRGKCSPSFGRIQRAVEPVLPCG